MVSLYNIHHCRSSEENGLSDKAHRHLDSSIYVQYCTISETVNRSPPSIHTYRPARISSDTVRFMMHPSIFCPWPCSVIQNLRRGMGEKQQHWNCLEIYNYLFYLYIYLWLIERCCRYVGLYSVEWLGKCGDLEGSARGLIQIKIKQLFPTDCKKS